MYRTTTFLLSISSKFTLTLSHLSFILLKPEIQASRMFHFAQGLHNLITGRFYFGTEICLLDFHPPEFDSSSMRKNGCRSWGRTKFTAFRERDTNRYINRHSNQKCSAIGCRQLTFLRVTCPARALCLNQNELELLVNHKRKLDTSSQTAM